MTGTILITGANRGIGLELVTRYAAEGWRVLACCRQPESAVELQIRSDRNPGRINIHALDVSDGARIRSLAAELKGEPIDILFNNAGVRGGNRQDPGNVDVATWLQTFRINTIAPLQMAAAFLDHIAGSRLRIIATMGSIMGSIAENSTGGEYIYRSTKAAVHMVGRSLAMDLRPRGIISVVLHPGWVKTDMGGPNAHIFPAESAAGLQRVLAQLRPEDSGRFFDFRGNEIPW